MRMMVMASMAEIRRVCSKVESGEDTGMFDDWSKTRPELPGQHHLGRGGRRARSHRGLILSGNCV